MSEENLKNLVGKKLSEISETMSEYYPIVDENDEILSFVDLDNDIVLQGDLPGKMKTYNIGRDFVFDKNLML